MSTDKTKYPTDPMDLNTRLFEPLEILYQANGFVIARGKWKDDVSPGPDAMACRWHSPGEIGYPQTFGKPQWFRLPISMRDVKKGVNPILANDLMLHFRQPRKELRIGQWARVACGGFSDWHLITYIYGEGESMVQGVGLGKKGSYPIEIGDIVETHETPAALATALKGKEYLFMDPRGSVWYVYPAEDATGLKNNGNVYRMTELVHAKGKSVIPSTTADELAVKDRPNWKLGETDYLGFTYQLSGMAMMKELDEPIVGPLNPLYEWLDSLDWDNLKVVGGFDLTGQLPDGFEPFEHDIVFDGVVVHVLNTVSR